MANEYLQRTPTSTGNCKVWTWAGWVKRNQISTTNALFLQGVNGDNSTQFRFDSGNTFRYEHADVSVPTDVLVSSNVFRDVSNWCHFVVSVDTTQEVESNRIQIYFNGDRQTNFGTASGSPNYPTLNFDTDINTLTPFKLGSLESSSNNHKGQLADVFLVDGQALTPDVFGFYKQGKGYISAGSTQATDFRPGQWVPKTPRVIKTEINRRGGFGVNGFYLPMNDSKNFGADFHCDPNSIITLNEKLPQPRVGVATTAAVGLGYTDVLRADPYAANLVLALPFVSSGLCTNGTNVGVNTGFGDYSHIIRNSGVAKTTELYGAVSMGNTGLYYGSSANFGGQGGDDYILTAASSDFVFSSNDFTIETWWFPTALGRQAVYHGSWGADYSIGIDFNGTDTNYRLGIWASSNGSNWNLANADAGGNGICGAGVTSNQWHHLAYERYGQNLTMYLNGVAVGIVTGITAAIDITATDKQAIGVWWNTTAMNEISGYLQDFRIYKGVAKYKGGFDVPRPYTPVGIATWRAVPDTTANNFATTNPLDLKQANGSLTFSDGNLKLVGATSNRHTRTTIGVTSTSVISGSQSKWYWEYYCSSSSPNFHHGISIGPSIENLYVDYLGNNSSSWGYWPNTTGTNTAYWRNGGTDVYTDLPRAVQGDVMMFALDMTSGKIYAGINGTWFKSGNPETGTNALSSNVGTAGTADSTLNRTVFPHFMQYDTTGISINFGQNPSFSGNTTAGTFTDSNGKGLFKYQPPSGFLALCEDNLPTPAISDPGKYFKTVLYTASGNGTVVGCGFTPDLVWIKNRDNIESHHLIDSVRGPKSFLLSNSTDVEKINPQNETGTFTFGFTNDGFSINDTNTAAGELYFNGRTYAAWCWRAGAGTTSTNTNGSVTSVVSVNQDAGFSIVSYTGNGTSGATIGHGLGRKPSFFVIKNRSAAGFNWPVYHSFYGATRHTILNGTNASATFTGLFNDTEPTTNVFSIGNDGAVNTNGSTYIAYCWAEIEGFSKFGSYVGNGNADGPMVWCGFKPAFVMIKRTDGTGNWVMHDNARNSTNPAKGYLLANSTAVEEAGNDILDFLSNGFKVRNSWTDINASGGTYVFAAWAESPFQTANSK